MEPGDFEAFRDIAIDSLKHNTPIHPKIFDKYHKIALNNISNLKLKDKSFQDGLYFFQKTLCGEVLTFSEANHWRKILVQCSRKVHSEEIESMLVNMPRIFGLDKNPLRRHIQPFESANMLTNPLLQTLKQLEKKKPQYKKDLYVLELFIKKLNENLSIYFEEERKDRWKNVALTAFLFGAIVLGLKFFGGRVLFSMPFVFGVLSRIRKDILKAWGIMFSVSYLLALLLFLFANEHDPEFSAEVTTTNILLYPLLMSSIFLLVFGSFPTISWFIKNEKWSEENELEVKWYKKKYPIDAEKFILLTEGKSKGFFQCKQCGKIFEDLHQPCKCIRPIPYDIPFLELCSEETRKKILDHRRLSTSSSRSSSKSKSRYDQSIAHYEALKHHVVVKGYSKVITDSSIIYPFQYTSELKKEAKELTRDCHSDREKAQKIYRYVVNKISYGKSKRDGVGYRTSTEVSETGEGVCGEQTNYFVTLARLAGLSANYVHVDIEYYGKEVNHGCAVVNTEEGPILVDTVYPNGFDIKHQKWSVKSDKEVMDDFTKWRDR